MYGVGDSSCTSEVAPADGRSSQEACRYGQGRAQCAHARRFKTTKYAKYPKRNEATLLVRHVAIAAEHFPLAAGSHQDSQPPGDTNEHESKQRRVFPQPGQRPQPSSNSCPSMVASFVSPEGECTPNFGLRIYGKFSWPVPKPASLRCPADVRRNSRWDCNRLHLGQVDLERPGFMATST